jgi:hypothetical protein
MTRRRVILAERDIVSFCAMVIEIVEEGIIKVGTVVST